MNRCSKRICFKKDGHRQNADGPLRRIDHVWVQNFFDTLVNGEECAEREENNGDNKRPEITLASVTKRMFAVRRHSRSFASKKQQHLISSIGNRVDAFGQQRTRTGEDEANELGNGDAKVGDHRCDNSSGGTFGRHRFRLVLMP